MLTEAIIQTSTPTSLKIDGADPEEILILKSISGLSDVKVTQYIGDFSREGSYYQGRRAERRNPVFNFKVQPNYGLNIMPNNIREMLYRMFMEPQRDSDAVQVLLKDDELPDRYFIGYTETINADMFTKDLTAQISLQTTDAYLRSASEVVASRPMGWLALPLPYAGTADTGIVVKMKVLDKGLPSITLQNGIDKMKLTGYFTTGDVIEIRTTEGDRAVLVNGQDRMVALTPDSPWITIKESQNYMRAYSTVEGDGRVVITDYSYRAAWWGI